MKLVVEYEVDGGDGCCNFTQTIPVQHHDSVESFIAEFEEKCQKKDTGFSFYLAGKEWYVSDHFVNGAFVPPNVYTVDQWFSAHQ